MNLANRNIKPENFLLTETEIHNKYIFKLSEFGVAVECNENKQISSLADSPFYMSPELYENYQTY